MIAKCHICSFLSDFYMSVLISPPNTMFILILYPIHPSFTIEKWGLKGYALIRYVILIFSSPVQNYCTQQRIGFVKNFVYKSVSLKYVDTSS